MKNSHKEFILKSQEILDREQNAYTLSLLERCRTAKNDIRRLDPEDRAEILREVQRLPSLVPLFHEVRGKKRVNPIEFTRRLMRLMESAAAAAVETSHKPRRHPDKGGWKPLRQPTPGSHSGAQRERDAGWA